MEIKKYSESIDMDMDEIRPYWRNPRVNDKTVTELMELIKQVGFNQPILVDKDKVIIKGHSRFYAMKRLGKKTIPTIISNEDDKTNRLNRINDNIIQEFSTWNMDLLQEELLEFNLDTYSGAKRLFAKALGIEQTKKQEGNPEGMQTLREANDVLMKYACPNCKREIQISRSEALSKENKK